MLHIETYTPTTITYNVTVSAGGCSASDDVTVNVFGGYILEDDTILYNSASLVFNATTNVPAYTYAWSTLSTASSINVTPTQTTTYTVTISDGTTTCEDSVTVTVSDIQTNTITGTDTTIQNYTKAYSVTQHSGSTYLWQVTGGTVQSGAGTNSVTILWTTLGNGSITVIETDTYSCQDTSILAVHVDLNTGITDLYGENGFMVLPNPANSMVMVSSKNSNDAIKELKLTDITGRMVFEKTNILSSKESIPVSELKEGLYFLDIITEKGRNAVVRVVVYR